MRGMPVRVLTLRTVGDQQCPNERTCPSVHDLDTDPERRFVIAKRVVDHAELVAFRLVIAGNEVLGYMPPQFIPAGNPLLDRTRGIRAPALRADRQYVILRPVVEQAVLEVFAGLVAPDELLGYVPAAELMEV